MKNKKFIKSIIIVFALIFILYFFAYNISANPTEDLFKDASGTLKGVNGGVDTTKGIFKGINTVIGLLQMAGTGISLIVITFLGIKYIVASVEDKAEIKKSAIPIVIGCVLLFGAVNIIALIESFTNSEINTESSSLKDQKTYAINFFEEMENNKV